MIATKADSMFIVEVVQLSSFSVSWSYKRAIVSPSIVQAVNSYSQTCFALDNYFEPCKRL